MKNIPNVLNLTPSVQQDVDGLLIVEEAHWSNLLIVVVFLCLIVPIGGTWIQAAEAGGQGFQILTAVFTLLLFGVPFLGVLFFGKHRSLEIVDGERLLSTNHYRFRPARSRVFLWSDIDHCFFRFYGRRHRRTVRLFLQPQKGKQKLLLAGHASDELWEALTSHLREKLTPPGNRPD